MHKLMILLISFLFTTNINSQNFTVSFSRPSQTVYLGMDNYLSCTVEGLSCKTIILSTDNGKFKKISCGGYIYRPLKVADTKITINKKVNNKLKKIGEFFVMVRNFPDPVAMIGGFYGGNIEKGNLRAQQGVGCSYNGTGFDLKCLVVGFSVSIIRNKEILFFKSLDGNLFNEDLKSFFKTLQNNDIILLSGISSRNAEGKILYLKPVEFTIKD